jgi:hypothetical protein
MCIIEQTPIGIDKDAVGFGNLLPQCRCRRIVREVLGTVLKSVSFVRSASISVSMHMYRNDSALGNSIISPMD